MWRRALLEAGCSCAARSGRCYQVLPALAVVVGSAQGRGGQASVVIVIVATKVVGHVRNLELEALRLRLKKEVQFSQGG